MDLVVVIVMVSSKQQFSGERQKWFEVTAGSNRNQEDFHDENETATSFFMRDKGGRTDR